MSKVDFSRLRETALLPRHFTNVVAVVRMQGRVLSARRGQVGHEFVAGQWRHRFPAQFNGDREVVVQFIVVEQCPEGAEIPLVRIEALAATSAIRPATRPRPVSSQ